MHDYQRMQPGNGDGHYGTMVQVFQQRPKGNYGFQRYICRLSQGAMLTSMVFCSRDAQASSQESADREDCEQ